MSGMQSSSMLGVDRHTAVLFVVGGFQFVIEADLVEEIRSLQGVEPIHWVESHPGLAKVTHVVHRGRRKFFVVDSGRYFQLPQSHSSRVLLLRRMDVGILVDGVDRMVEFGAVYPLPEAFEGAERSWYLGLTLLQQRLVPVVNSASFVTEEELAVLRSATHSRQIEAENESTKVQLVKDWGLRSGGHV